ncbi:Dipeptide-binding ABC transporter, periplasmic substrate-binding component [Enhygromyxa salina]|uniref:Dipeptide-binding ABC transporter, periplasmic substrate-binding component n=1 Tax=Enhygromyxa salina TaxID=215803 RepID=A0A0C1ZT27_9BACT|nr:FG-GAP-like repeat-containing protein [Enhygromyxa salina]KIG14188.1 Dipeptide-binding ABC transporter, periplasmic substrate-binding component [Enhygromyxa salina]
MASPARYFSISLVAALPLACGDNAAGTGDASEQGISTSDTAETAGDGDGDAGDGDGDPGDGDGDCADPCGDECCGDQESCDLNTGTCEIDCGEAEPCGDPAMCCGDGQLCYGGGCIVPGDPCQVGVCATDTDTGCGPTEVCDPDLDLCVPNLADNGCTYEPEPGVFDPVPRFTWGSRKNRVCDGDADCQKEEICDNGSCAVTWPHIQPADDDLPAFYQAVSTPAVGDLDGDCIPEIVFNTYQNSSYTANGVLRAIHGDTGEKLWTFSDPDHESDSGATPAIGDLDGDGSPEIINPGEGPWLYALSAQGNLLWKSDSYSGSGKSGSPSLANMDLQGNAEIVYGRAVFDSNGALLWQGSDHVGNNGSVGQLSCVADLDGDLRPEVIAGGTAYAFTGTVGVDFDGSVLWKHGSDGYCGIADFQLDGVPEVVVVRSNSIDVLDGPTGTLLASISIAGGGAGGPPNIADFDGDGFPDIGTAGGNNYVVVQFDGVDQLTQLWQASTKDGSSQRTGSSVFDFDGDGRSEVVYGDEWYLRIYPGTEPDCDLMIPGPNCDGDMTDAEILFIDINSSRTRAEYPVIADVDGDFKAEIIVTTNNESSQGAIGDAGVEVFEDRLDNWVGTLPIWNQHTYHVTNVDAKGGIPIVEENNWQVPVDKPENSYRRNAQGAVANCAPDLVLEDLVQVGACLDNMMTLRVRVCNQGCLGVGPGVKVTFSEQDAGVLGTASTAAAIVAGACQTVELTVPTPNDAAPYFINASVDDDGMGGGALNECIEDNNDIGPQEFCLSIG